MNMPSLSEDIVIPISQMGRLGTREAKELGQAMGYLRHRPGSGIQFQLQYPLCFPHPS